MLYEIEKFILYQILSASETFLDMREKQGLHPGISPCADEISAYCHVVFLKKLKL